MDPEYEVGQPLIVELDDEILVGDLKLISTDGRMVELTNVRDLKTGYIYTSSQCLPRPLIKSIRQCKTEYTNSTKSKQEQAAKVAELPKEDILNITTNEIDQIQTIVAASTYIFQTDQKYHKAIADIKQQNAVSLHMEPTQFGRHNKTSLLIVATFHSVYIFDIILLGKLFKELKDILQSQRPKKIVFYSNKIADSLKYQHGVELAGVFDIYVAHCLISKQKKPITFGRCATKYFNIPENYFQGEDELMKDIYKRPLARTYLDVVSKKVIFLYKLYEYMLHDIMLKNFYKQCNDFSVAFVANKDAVEVVMQMKPNTVHGTDCIGSEEWADMIERKLSLNSTLSEDSISQNCVNKNIKNHEL